ncbi:hypothetical protein CDD83_2864 [Cordyceps sp. RAO-2017]|nr:hypothetical protein CDD83_2864 [Cordyceps sp. RAO-2017]
MTDPRPFGDLTVGHFGLSDHLPAKDSDQNLGLLHTTKRVGNPPRFEIVGSTAELYPPSKSAAPQASSTLWKERRLQRRWLLGAHPEAFMGDPFVQECLKEDMERFVKAGQSIDSRRLLTVCQMADLRVASDIGGMPLLAAATGESGEQLRLSRVDESRWLWEDGAKTVLHLSVVDAGYQEEEALWMTDFVPITQVKAATYLAPSSSFRWLLVQKPTSTTILQPEYHPVPVPGHGAAGDSTQQPLSFVNPNPVLTLDNHRTGGNAHSDVSFNPPGPGRPARLAIMDECGYWTLWDILGTWNADKKTLRLSPYRCGHMCGGILDSIPPQPAYPADRHGMLHVGEPEADAPSNRQAVNGWQEMAKPSRYLLMWRTDRCEVLDLESNTSFGVPELALYGATKTDRILDIQRSRVNEDHVFVLTSQRLLWVDVFGRGSSPEGKHKPKILLCCPHISAHNEDMKMCVGRASADDADPSLVFNYSSKTEQLSVHWFGFSRATGLPELHSHITELPGVREMPRPTAIRQLRFQPAELEGSSDESAAGLGSSYLRSGVRFYQVSILGEDLSVRYCICTASADPTLDIVLPSTRIGWSTSEQRRRWRRKRKRFLQHVGDAFVLPDSAGDEDLKSVLQRKDEDGGPSQGGAAEEPPHKPRPVMLNFREIAQAVHEQLVRDSAKAEPRLPRGLVGSVHQVLRDGMQEGRLPLTTWAEIANSMEDLSLDPMTDEEIDSGVDTLLGMSDEKTIVTYLGRRDPGEPSRSCPSFADVKRQLSEMWLDPDTDKFSEELQRMRKGWVSEIAIDAFLSSLGVAVQDVPLFGDPGTEDADDEYQSTMATSQWSSKRADDTAPPFIHSSQAPSQAPSASPSSIPPGDAFQRLKLLVPSLEPGKFGEMKQSKVLSYWPTERGVDTRGYVSSVAVATEEKFKDAKERLQKKQAKRRALVDKYKRPAFMRQGFPTSAGPSQEGASLPMRPAPRQFMSSPQASPEPPSQAQGPRVTMSQPVPGAFGDRKKGKKQRRKSGFR